MTLAERHIGQDALIQTVGGEGALRQHLLDMGLTPGTEVTLRKVAPMGDPIELELRGYELTLRLDDALKIEICDVHTTNRAAREESRHRVVPHPGVGELRKAKASKAKFGNVRLSSKKLMCKVIISNDLIRSNAYGADQTILNDATTAMALAMDRAAFLGKGTEFEPMGLFNMDIPTVELNAAPNEGTTGKLLAKLLQNNADTSKLGWAINGFAWEAFYNVVQAASGLYLYRDQMDAGNPF